MDVLHAWPGGEKTFSGAGESVGQSFFALKYFRRRLFVPENLHLSLHHQFRYALLSSPPLSLSPLLHAIAVAVAVHVAAVWSDGGGEGEKETERDGDKGFATGDLHPTDCSSASSVRKTN